MSENSRLENVYLTYDQLAELSVVHARERRYISLGLGLVVVVTIQDFVEDLLQGQGWYYVLADLAYMGIMLALLAYIWRHAPLSLRRRNIILTQEVINRHRDAESWRQRTAGLLRGLSDMLDQQLTAWNLSAAEKQIALLILKGLSLKEIAAIRKTGEPTVRQQAAQIYTKAGVSGRAELSAFFLEDLLLPVDE